MCELNASPTKHGPPEPAIRLDDNEIETAENDRQVSPQPKRLPAGDMESHELFAFDIISTMIHR